VSIRLVSLPRAAAIAVVALGATLLAPAGQAHAAVPTGVTDVTWNVRTSWVDYLTNPAFQLWTGQGSVTTTSSNGAASTPAAGTGTTAWGGSWTEYAYSYEFGVASDTGSPRVTTLQGGLAFEQSWHGIDVELTNLRIVDDPSGPESLLVDGHYTPLFGSAVPLTNVDAFTIAETATSGVYTVTLTEAGAEIFNGGDNGSYEANEAFGSVSFG
jgi:hypothetical protein